MRGNGLRALGLWLVMVPISGCPSSTTAPSEDAGGDAARADTGGAPIDAGVDAAATDDANVIPDDAATVDAATVDAGHDAAAPTDAGDCPTPCGPEPRACCNGACVYTYNDAQNCGACGRTCAADEYCAGGSCAPRPCEATCSGGLCCGSQCCNAGQICCDPAGPVGNGPVCTTPTEGGSCPAGCAPLCVCASPDTLIATPSGERAIADLVAGDLVYSAEGGALAVVPLAAVHRTWVGGDHRIVRVVLETGRVLEISPGHPTADGRFFSDLRPGDLLDGARVIEAELVPYGHDYTYDVLPASETATYVAGGVLIGSTMAPSGAPIALTLDDARAE